MLIRNKKTFNIGFTLFLLFSGCLVLIFSPIFGNNDNGLKFADNSFNKLSKGSSYFIPSLSEKIKKFQNQNSQFNIQFNIEGDALKTTKLFQNAGAIVTVNNNELTVKGSFYEIINAALIDSNFMFNNNGAVISEKYGYNEKEVMKNWWLAFSAIEKKFTKSKLLEEAKIVSAVRKKAIEPSYNFYQIEQERVSDHTLLLTGLLVFYVFYTLWWGYAIFYLFDGLGLTMKKAKIKKEV